MSLMIGDTFVADVLSAISAVEVDLLLRVGAAYFVGRFVFAGGFDHTDYILIN